MDGVESSMQRSSTYAVSRSVLADQIYNALLQWLMDGRLQPGDRVSIDGMAREFNVSPTPVREALARLESTGMVAREAMRGYRVPPLPTEKQIADLMDVRMTIEPRMAELACASRDDTFLEELEVAVADLRSTPSGPRFNDYRDYLEADERFHRLIATQCGNDYMLRAYDSLGGHVQRFRLFSGLGVTDAEFAVAEHAHILDAIRAGDCKEAAQRMRAHVAAVRDRALADRRKIEQTAASTELS